MKRTYPTLLLAVVIVSSSSILIRWTGDVSFAAISFYRLLFSLPFLIIYNFSRKPASIKNSRKYSWRYSIAGIFLVAHFFTWIASLQLTTIANSIFLEGTHPIFALVISIFLLKETPKLSILPGFFVAFIGMFFIVYSDFNQSGSQIIGDSLAILSALMVALYFMTARMYKDKADLITYLIYVYGSAAILCAVYMWIFEISFIGFSWKSWGLIFLLALGPNLFGHSLLNWASRRIEIYKVNVVLVLEPVLATISGMIFLSEYPEYSFYLGALLIILALIFIIVRESNNKLSK